MANIHIQSLISFIYMEINTKNMSAIHKDKSTNVNLYLRVSLTLTLEV